jgi:hypothetical protein
MPGDGGLNATGAARLRKPPPSTPVTRSRKVSPPFFFLWPPFDSSRLGLRSSGFDPHAICGCVVRRRGRSQSAWSRTDPDTAHRNAIPGMDEARD